MSYSHQKGFSWLSLLFFLAVFGALVVVLLPLGFHRGHGSDRVKALANTKSIAAALMCFKQDNGAYPCDRTRKILEEKEIDFLPDGESANAYFAQLLVSETIDSETAFFAPGGMVGAKEGDNIKDSPPTILAPGENGYAYIMAPDGRSLTDTSPDTPLILAPVRDQRGGAEPRFDPDPYDGKFVYGLADGSSATGEIDEDGHAISKDHEPFFQTGSDSLFGNDTPVVKYPLGLQ